MASAITAAETAAATATKLQFFCIGSSELAVSIRMNTSFSNPKVKESAVVWKMTEEVESVLEFRCGEKVMPSILFYTER